MCRVEIRNVVALDTNNDNQRDELIIAGIVEDCAAVKVGIFDGPPPQGAEAADGVASTDATIHDPGVEAHGVVPAGNERVFTATFTLFDTTIFKGECGDVPTATIGLLAVCVDDAQCRHALVWDQAIPCEGGRRDCELNITLTSDVSDQCVTTSRGVALTIVVNPPAQGLSAEVDFGDGSTEIVSIDSIDVGGGIVIAIATVNHDYSVPGNGTITFTITVSIVGRPECQETLDVTLDQCPDDGPPPPPPPPRCPVERVTLIVLDENGTNVTTLAEGDCLPPGTYEVRAVIEPSGATDTFLWRVDGESAEVGERDVVSIDGDELTIQLNTSFRSVSVIAAGCASDGIDLRPCEPLCCPNLTGLTASCMPRCPRSTTVTLQATGDDLECAEVFQWDFGDGTTIESNSATETHTYPAFAPFDAAVTIVRPDDCGGPRIQRETVRVNLCPPPCYCVLLAIASGFLLLLLLALMPLIACSTDPATVQTLTLIFVATVILLVIFALWWLLDQCCRPTWCELVRILIWVISWALVFVGAIVTLGVCVSAIPFGLIYVLIQQFLIRNANENQCGVPDIFSWPFPTCRG